MKNFYKLFILLFISTLTFAVNPKTPKKFKGKFTIIERTNDGEIVTAITFGDLNAFEKVSVSNWNFSGSNNNTIILTATSYLNFNSESITIKKDGILGEDMAAQINEIKTNAKKSIIHD